MNILLLPLDLEKLPKVAVDNRPSAVNAILHHHQESLCVDIVESNEQLGTAISAAISVV